MKICRQFSIFMVNKPGVLANVLDTFAKAKVNVVALTVSDSSEHGVLRVVFRAPEKAGEILSGLNMQYSETDVLCLNLANKSGALADAAHKLAQNHINILYAYCTAGAKGGRTTGVLKVSDLKKAMRVLGSKYKGKSKSQPSVRRSPAAKG